jgi:hypothetical protein
MSKAILTLLTQLNLLNDEVALSNPKILNLCQAEKKEPNKVMREMLQPIQDRNVRLLG